MTLTLRSHLVVLVLAASAALCGCAGVEQRISNVCYGLTNWAQRKHDLADIRTETREALAVQEQEALRMTAERDVEAARIDAENRRLEMEFCRANQEALQMQARRNIRETVESKLAIPVEHGLEFGELEVDVQELEALLRKRQEQPPPQEPVRRPPCSCCDAPCGCEPGLLRRHCHRCRHKRCEAERDCGGPEALRLAQEAVKRPLRPAEIPMKLPVRLNFGFQQPQMEAARIRRVPDVPPEAVKRPCERCGPGGCVHGGHCPVPCTQAAPPPSAYQPARPTVPTSEPQIGPAPVPEGEARRPASTDWHGFQLGMIR